MDSFICKTVGIQALFDVLMVLAQDGLAAKNFSVDFFLDKLKAAADVDFSNDRFKNASGSGRLLIKNCFFVKLGLEKEKMNKLSVEKLKIIDDALAGKSA